MSLPPSQTLCPIIMGKLSQSTSCARHMAVTQNTKKWKIQSLFPAPMFSVEDWKLHSLRESKLPCVGHYCSVSAFLPSQIFLIVHLSLQPFCLPDSFLFILSQKFLLTLWLLNFNSHFSWRLGKRLKKKGSLNKGCPLTHEPSFSPAPLN